MRNRKSFTLIEVLVTLTVVFVLAATAYVSYDLSRRRSEYRAMRANVYALTNAIKSYFYSMRAYSATANTAQTNTDYGTLIQDGRFCRYRVFLSAPNIQLRVQFYPNRCGVGAATNFYFDIDGQQTSCVGTNCLT